MRRARLAPLVLLLASAVRERFETFLAFTQRTYRATLRRYVRDEAPCAGRVCFTYVRDPQGNLIELQRWR